MLQTSLFLLRWFCWNVCYFSLATKISLGYWNFMRWQWGWPEKINTGESEMVLNAIEERSRYKPFAFTPSIYQYMYNISTIAFVSMDTCSVLRRYWRGQESSLPWFAVRWLCIPRTLYKQYKPSILSYYQNNLQHHEIIVLN